MVLGIDASISSTGYAVVSYGGFNRAIEFGKLTTKKNNKIDSKIDEDERIFYITNELSNIIDRNYITVAVMESQFIGNNAKTGMQLSRLRGSIMYMIKSKGINIKYLTPSEIRKILMNNGSATKEEVAEYIREYYKDDQNVQDLGEFNDKANKSKNSDIYDALSIGLAHNKDKAKREGLSA